MAGRINALDFASGSPNTYTGTIASGSTTLSGLPSTHDFQIGQGILVINAGTLCDLPAPSLTGFAVTPVGASGTTSYTYAIATIDNFGGMSQATSLTVTNLAPALTPAIYDPDIPLTLSASGAGSTLTNQAYYVGYTVSSPAGSTTLGFSTASITPVAGNNITTNITVPSGAINVGVYVGTSSSNMPQLASVTISGTTATSNNANLSVTSFNNNTLAVSISSSGSGSTAPTSNTATAIGAKIAWNDVANSATYSDVKCYAVYRNNALIGIWAAGTNGLEFYDYGAPTATPPMGLSATPPASATARNLLTSVVGLPSTTSLTLANAATTTVTGTVLHDDTVALQNAIKALGSGYSLYFPAATYRISYSANDAPVLSVTGRNNIVFFGDGNASQIIVSGYVNTYTFLWEQCNGITIRDLLFDGGIQAPFITPVIKQSKTHIFSYNTVNVSVRNCEFQHIGDTALSQRTQSMWSANYPNTTDVERAHFILTNCRFHDLNSALNTTGSGANFGIVSGNHIHDCLYGCVKIDGGGYGGAMYPTENCSWDINGNIFHDITCTVPSACIVVEEHSANVLIRGNIMWNIGIVSGSAVDCIDINPGQTIRNTKHIRIYGNQFRNFRQGIVIRPNSSPAGVTLENISIVENDFANSMMDMILVETANANTLNGLNISGNTFTDWGTLHGGSYYRAIDLYIASNFIYKNINIEDNKFIRSSSKFLNDYAVMISNSAASYDTIVIKDNRYVGQTINDFIVCLSSNTHPYVIRDNQFSNGEIYFLGTSQTVDLIHNEFHNVQVLSESSSGSTLAAKDNRLIMSSSTYPFWVLQNGSSLYEEKNRYTGGKVPQVSVDSTSTWNRSNDEGLTTTNQTMLATFNPTAQGDFIVYVSYRVVQSTNLTVTVTYTDGSNNAQTVTLVSGTQAIGSQRAIANFNATTASAINVNATASLANAVFISSSIFSL